MYVGIVSVVVDVTYDVILRACCVRVVLRVLRVLRACYSACAACVEVIILGLIYVVIDMIIVMANILLR